MSLEIRVELRPLRDGRTHVVTPSGSHLDINVELSVIRAALEAEANQRQSQSSPIADALKSRGCLAARSDPLPVLVQGGSRWTDLARSLVQSLPNLAEAVPGTQVANAFPALLHCADFFDIAGMLKAEHQVRSTGGRLVTWHTEGSVVHVLGPFGGQNRVSIRDVFSRRLNAARSTSELRICLEPSTYGSLQLDPSHVAHGLMLALRALSVNADDTPNNLIGAWSISNGALDTRQHSILAMPESDWRHAGTSSSPPATLVDELYGIVTRVEPVRLAQVTGNHLVAQQAWVSHTKRSTGRDTSGVNAGFSPSSSEVATITAIAESAERYSSTFPRDSDLEFASYRQLIARGEQCLSPDSIAGFSEDQHSRGIPFSRFDQDTQLRWVQMCQIGQSAQVWFPASLVYLNYFSEPYADEAPIAPQNFAGISAGPDVEFALQNGIEEVIERDAMMTWWLSGRPAPEIVSPDVDRSGFEGFETWFLRLPSACQLPAVAAVIVDPTEETLAVGFACRRTLQETCWKAWTEAVALHGSNLELLKPDGLWLRKQDRLGSLGLKPFRPDRQYSKSFRHDWSDVTSLFAQMQANLDPSVARQSYELLKPVGISDGDSPANIDTFADYSSILDSAGLNAFWRDLTTPDIASCGLRVTRVMIPGLLPNYSTAYPTLRSDRLVRVLRNVGRSHNPLPLPYA